MRQKPLIATYAAGASLAAITLIYVFAPTYFLDSSPEGGAGSSSSRCTKWAVGLINPANDCFINSVLQALAGLGDLRIYLIRETYQRCRQEAERGPPTKADRNESSSSINLQQEQQRMPDWKVQGLEAGVVTKGLKDMLDALNERPIYRKTTSAQPFVHVLELAFRQRISRQQQDAQEFLHVVAERLCDEYHARRKAARRAKTTRAAYEYADSRTADKLDGTCAVEPPQSGEKAFNDDEALDNKKRSSPTPRKSIVGDEDDDDDENGGFPMEGSLEAHIECQTCRFRPKPTESIFCTLTLNVPPTSTSLNACFDGLFKTEYIDDFKCDKCRLVHAQAVYRAALGTAMSDSEKAHMQDAIDQLQKAIDTDPEERPEGVSLPDSSQAPKGHIARHIRLSRFPKILAIHLSRSIYNASHISQKNSAKVIFPERLSLGGLLQQRRYKLLAVVTHRGSHYTGHYETFRRQNMWPPFANANTFQGAEQAQKAKPSGCPINTQNTPQLASVARLPDVSRPSSVGAPAGGNVSIGLGIESTATTEVDDTVPRISTPSLASRLAKQGNRSGEGDTHEILASDARASAPRHETHKPAGRKGPRLGRRRKQKRPDDRWWRISDEKVKEASTEDVLDLQREVYLLFYELEKTPAWE